MEEYYGFDQMMGGEEIGSELFAMFLGIGMVFLVIYGIFAIISYVFQSIGLYTIAVRRGIKNPWLAWIPCGNYWMAGTISDQYQYVVKGQIKNNRIIMLVLALVSLVAGVISSIISGDMMESLMDIFLFGGSGDYSGGVGTALGVGAGVSSLLSLVESGVSIALLVFWHISLYNLYNSCDPKNAVLFTVLGILFSVTVPFFIFSCRKKDAGMPPRKSANAVPQQENPAWQPVEPIREPWENPTEE